MPGSVAQRRGSPVERHAAGGRAVIRAIARQDLVPAGVQARQLDRVLVGVGAAVGEEEDVDVAGSELRELGAEAGARLGGHERIDVGSSAPARCIAAITRSSPWPMFTPSTGC